MVKISWSDHISYATQVKDYAALGVVNQVVVSYKLNDETTNQNIYGGKFT